MTARPLAQLTTLVTCTLGRSLRIEPWMVGGDVVLVNAVDTRSCDRTGGRADPHLSS